MHGDVVDDLLESSLDMKEHLYDVCKNGCKLYGTDKNEDKCQHCNEVRFKQNASKTPKATMSILSIGECLAQMLASPKTNNLLKYRSERETTPNSISDIFDGQNYKDLVQKGLFSNPDDIAIGIFTDGFVNQKKGKSSYTIIHVIIFNFDPSIRYYITIQIYKINKYTNIFF